MPRQDKIRVGVVFGGRSSEHEVSLASAQNVMRALRDAGYEVTPIGIAPTGLWLTGTQVERLTTGSAVESYAAQDGGPTESTASDDTWALLPHDSANARLPLVDVVFPVLHGPYGEDGTIQGLLEMANIPYVGCGVLSSAAAMDKAIAKKLFHVAGLPQTPSVVVLRPDWNRDASHEIGEIEAQLAYPLFVKPANMGSSVGVSKARNRSELCDAVQVACQYDRKVIVEQAVPNAREIEVSVLGNDRPVASLPGEIIPGAEFYDYDAKYVNDSSELIIPAPLSKELTAQARDQAVRAFQAVDGTGLARVDFLLDDTSGVLYLNELNTMPGFTRISMYPKLWEASGVSYAELVSRLVDLAMERFADRQQNRTTR